MNREEQDTLERAMAELAKAERKIGPPAELESMLLREFEAVKVPRIYWKAIAGVGALAAAVALFAVLHTTTPAPVVQGKPAAAPVRVVPAIEKKPAEAVRKPLRRQARAAKPLRRADDEGSFVAIPFTVPPDPNERMTVMRVAMPVSALVAVGLTMPTPDPSVNAQADVVVGEDGRIRAVRLIDFQNSEFSADRRTNP